MQAGRVQRTESDISVYLFSIRPLSSVIAGEWTGATGTLTETHLSVGLPESRPVILYVHGGGWFTRFFCMDYQILSEWAKETGAVIVYVGTSNIKND